MRRWSPRHLLPVLVLWAGGGCAESGSTGHTADSADLPGIQDHEGRRVTLESPPERIISLVPSATEILLQLGAGHRLVGRTEYDVHPGLADLPSVGGGLHPSLERLLDLRPQLVIRFGGESDRATPSGLDAAGIAHLAIRPDGVQKVLEIVGFLGRVVGQEDAARELAERIQRELREVEEGVRDYPRRRVAYVLGGSPPWVAGGGTFIHELVEIAGGENVFGELELLYAPVSPELLLTGSIEAILATPDSRLELPPGGPPVIRVPEITQAPGYRMGEAARALALLLHPGAPL